MKHVCFWLEVDGLSVCVLGDPTMSAETRGTLLELVRAVKQWHDNRPHTERPRKGYADGRPARGPAHGEPDPRPPSQVCREDGYQACHDCDDLECCDNESSKARALAQVPPRTIFERASAAMTERAKARHRSKAHRREAYIPPGPDDYERGR